MQDIYDRKLSIYLTAGQDDEGKDIVKAKSFSNVRLNTTDEELSNFRDKYVALSSDKFSVGLLMSIERVLP